MSADLALAVHEFGVSLRGSERTSECFDRIVDVASRYLRGCDGASISLRSEDTTVTPAWTHDVVVDVDTLQYETQEGPCLDAIAHGTCFYASDLATDARWPSFGPLASARGMHALLSFPLSSDGLEASLNLYAMKRDAYAPGDVMLARVFASIATDALAHAEGLESTRRELDERTEQLRRLERAVRLRADIDRAVGILMRDRSVTAAGAFTQLRLAAEQTNLSLHDVAVAVVAGGRIPDPLDLLGGGGTG